MATGGPRTDGATGTGTGAVTGTKGGEAGTGIGNRAWTAAVGDATTGLAINTTVASVKHLAALAALAGGVLTPKMGRLCPLSVVEPGADD